jgi:hypothetical protein
LSDILKIKDVDKEDMKNYRNELNRTNTSQSNTVDTYNNNNNNNNNNHHSGEAGRRWGSEARRRFAAVNGRPEKERLDYMPPFVGGRGNEWRILNTNNFFLNKTNVNYSLSQNTNLLGFLSFLFVSYYFKLYLFVF